MSSYGLVAFSIISISIIFIPTTEMLPIFIILLSLVFSLSMGLRGLKALRRAFISVIPLGMLLSIVWIGVVGHAPDVMMSYHPSKTVLAWQGVTAIASRLFVLASLTFGIAEKGEEIRPSFLAQLRLPHGFKVLLYSISSLTDVMRQGLYRAQTALVAANVLTSRMSFRNLRLGWLLLRSTWVAAVGMAVERLDTKWAYENLPANVTFHQKGRTFTYIDLIWVSVATLVLVVTLTFFSP